MARHLMVGKLGEIIAAEHLKRLGYRISKTDFRMRFGQIDIVATESESIVFIEVKTRLLGTLSGFPEEAVTAEKRRKLIMAAQAYLIKYQPKNDRCRFDVVSILLTREMVPIEIRLIKNAFGEERDVV